MPDPASPVLTDSLARTLKRLFFASGATGLIYETIFVKVFGYTFGTTAYATATVLAAFMGGLALGSYAVGRMATRSKRPILLYATLELATGLYCLFTPFWHRLVTDGYVRLHESLQPDGATLTAIRFALAFLVVLIPSTLMGGTLPAILKSALTRKAGLSGQIGSFYAANLGGAATGTLVSTFLLLPTGGLYGALAVAVLVNVAIFAVCVRLSRGVAVEAPGEPVESGGGGPADAPRGRLPYAAVLGIAAFSGLSSLAYENIFSHVFGTLIGSSAFAFGTMLFTFLLGLAFGGRLSAGFARRGKAPEALAASLLAPPVLLAAGVPFYDRIDSLYGLVGLTAPSFLVMEGCRFLVCVAVMLAPATLFGMVFPLCMEMAGGRMQDTPRRIGAIYAVNTLASVVGSLLAGFVMIGRLGSQDSFRVLGAAGLVVGLAVLFRLLADRRRRLVWGGGAAAGFLLATGLLPAWNIGRITGGSWVYFTHDHSRAEVIHFEEDVHGGMTTVTQEGKVRTMWTNGKFQGNNATEMSVQRGFAVYPVLLQNRFERALNIGFGTGVTAATLGRFPFKKIEIAEIAPSIVRASRFFEEENRHILDDPRVRVHLVDGRNHLLLTSETYDVISIEVSSIWIAGAANLFNEEFYELCHRRLAPGGVLQQWVQLHHLNTFDLLLILNTAREVFPHCALFQVEHQGILVCSREPLRFDLPSLLAQDARPETEDLRRGLPLGTLLAYAGDVLVWSDELDQALNQVVGRLGRWRPLFVSRDYWPALEYWTPRGNAERFALEANLGYLKRFGRRHLPDLTGDPSPALVGALLERRGDLGAALVAYESDLSHPGAAEQLDRVREILLRSTRPGTK